jgi:hypothetical protein
MHVYILSIYQSTYLPTYLSVYLPTYLPTYLSIYLPVCLPTYLPIQTQQLIGPRNYIITTMPLVCDFAWDGVSDDSRTQSNKSSDITY